MAIFKLRFDVVAKRDMLVRIEFIQESTLACVIHAVRIGGYIACPGLRMYESVFHLPFRVLKASVQ